MTEHEMIELLEAIEESLELSQECLEKENDSDKYVADALEFTRGGIANVHAGMTPETAIEPSEFNPI